MSDNKELTTEDKALLQEYIEAMDALAEQEPIRLSGEQWDVITDAYKATGEIPAEYADIVGVIKEKDGSTSFTDKVWESWNAKEHKVIHKYHDVILKALNSLIWEKGQTRNVDDTIRAILKGDTENLPQVLVRQLKSIVFPVDKVNKNIWGLLEQPTDGQLTLNFDVTADKDKESKKPVTIMYSLDFNSLANVSVTKKLEPYDKRVYLAISALFNEGYDVISVNQIYAAMGYTGDPGQKDREKINNAITKMNSAHLIIDNKYEAKSYKYDHFKYDGVLLPMERMQAYINGQLSDAAIHIFREPPMVSFAKQRKQVTTIDIKLLDSPLNKNNATIELEDYFIEEIARIKKGERNPKMLYSTIYENAHITTSKQKQRAPQKIKKLLDFYKQKGFIDAYQVVSDGIIIKCKK
jgi:hypothetical protein